MKNILRLNVFLFLIISVTMILLRFLPHPEPQTHSQQKVSTRLNAQNRTPSRLPTVWSSPLPAVPPTTPPSFYRTIIDNNLFRPLGWTPPRPREPYRLLGTIIPTDAKTPPKAIIQNIVRNQTHIVTIGDTLDTETHVTDIQTKHITLKKNGQRRQLTLKSSFLQRR